MTALCNRSPVNSAKRWGHLDHIGTKIAVVSIWMPMLTAGKEVLQWRGRCQNDHTVTECRIQRVLTSQYNQTIRSLKATQCPKNSLWLKGLSVSGSTLPSLQISLSHEEWCKSQANLSPDPGAEQSAVLLECHGDFPRAVRGLRRARLLLLLLLLPQLIRLLGRRHRWHLHCWVRLPAHTQHVKTAQSF